MKSLKIQRLTPNFVLPSYDFGECGIQILFYKAFSRSSGFLKHVTFQGHPSTKDLSKIYHSVHPGGTFFESCSMSMLLTGAQGGVGD